MANAATELQSVVIVEEVPAETQFAIHKDILHVLQRQAVKLLSFHLAIVIAMVRSACLICTALRHHVNGLHPVRPHNRPGTMCAGARGAWHSTQDVNGATISISFEDEAEQDGLEGPAPRRAYGPSI